MSNQEKNLSTDEMAALRDVAAPIESEGVSAEEAAKVQVLSYNFRQPGRLSGAQLRALKVVHEYFAKRFSEDRPGGINMAFDLSLLSVETVSYSNFMGSLGNPCFMTQLSSRFDQPVLMEIDLPLVSMLVSRILGDEEEAEEEIKPLTSIEQAIAGNWIEGILPVLGESWELSAPVNFGLKSIESDPRFVQVMPDDNPVVSVSFRFQAGGKVGQLTLCYPLEPLQELVEGMSLKMSGGDDDEGDSEQDGARVLASLKGVPFELRAELGCCSIRASQLATLRTGDVLCLDRSIHDSVDVFLGNNLVFEAGFGRKGDNLALQLCNRRTVN
jgi:flagellar motor switch protein FliM